MVQVAWGSANVAFGREIEGRRKIIKRRRKIIKRRKIVETGEKLRELVQETEEELVETTFPRSVVRLVGMKTLVWARCVVLTFTNFISFCIVFVSVYIQILAATYWLS